MTKQELIKKAYEELGFNWEEIKEELNGDGWLYDEVLNHIKPEYEPDEFDALLLNSITWIYRPKTLKGIENNFGWISINERLPDFEQSVLLIYKYEKSIHQGELLLRSNKLMWNVLGAFTLEGFNEYTHWQPLIQQPITE